MFFILVFATLLLSGNSEILDAFSEKFMLYSIKWWKNETLCDDSCYPTFSYYKNSSLPDLKMNSEYLICSEELYNFDFNCTEKCKSINQDEKLFGIDVFPNRMLYINKLQGTQTASIRGPMTIKFSDTFKSQKIKLTIKFGYKTIAKNVNRGNPKIVFFGKYNPCVNLTDALIERTEKRSVKNVNVGYITHSEILNVAYSASEMIVNIEHDGLNAHSDEHYLFIVNGWFDELLYTVSGYQEIDDKENVGKVLTKNEMYLILAIIWITMTTVFTFLLIKHKKWFLKLSNIYFPSDLSYDNLELYGTEHNHKHMD